MNNKNILNKNTENFTSTKLDWSIIQSEMRNKLGNDVYESWLKKISFVEELKNYVLLSVSTRFIRDWITSRYLDQILQIIKIYKKDINRVELKINEKKDENINQISQREISSLYESGNVAFIKDTYLQYNTIDSNKKFENFIIGSSNKLAFEASKKITENISRYNPLYIYGGVGMGKTHLLNAIGLSLKEKNKVMFISAERFMYQFVKSIKSNEMVKFKEYFRNTDILLIEQSQSYQGLYFVLSGYLSPIDGIGAEELGLDKLKDIFEKTKISELILATNATLEGEITADYIKTMADKFDVKTTRLAHGIPLGGELEYIDSHTLAHAFKGRNDYE
jgi:chromosomal replication initiator protein